MAHKTISYHTYHLFECSMILMLHSRGAASQAQHEAVGGTGVHLRQQNSKDSSPTESAIDTLKASEQFFHICKISKRTSRMIQIEVHNKNDLFLFFMYVKKAARFISWLSMLNFAVIWLITVKLEIYKTLCVIEGNQEIIASSSYASCIFTLN